MLAVLGGLAALLVCELALRAVMPAKPAELDPQVAFRRFECDPGAGRAATYWVLAEEPAESFTFDQPVRVNSLGLRGPEPRERLPADALRVVAVGDSHTFGVGVAEADTWPAQLERVLRAQHPDREVEVVNAGVPALNVEQVVSLFLERALALRPDFVVVAYYWNDMPEWGDPRGEFQPGQPVIPPSMRPPKDRPARAAPSAPSAPALRTRIKDVLRSSYLANLLIRKVPAIQHSFFPGAQTMWRRAILDGVDSNRIDGSWGFVESQLGELAQTAREHDFELLIVPVPLFEQMTAGYTDLRGYQGRVRRICARIDAEFVDPLPAILATGPSATTDFVPFDGHPTGRVYGAIAAAIAEHLGR